MNCMVREEKLGLERKRHLHGVLMSHRETMQARLDTQRQELEREIEALEARRQESPHIEDEREARATERMAAKQTWRNNVEMMKMEQAQLKLEWDRSEKKKFKQGMSTENMLQSKRNSFSNKPMNQKESEERKRSNIQTAFQVRLDQMEASYLKRKESLPKETMRFRDHFQKKMDRLYDDKKLTKDQWLKIVNIEEEIEKETEMLLNEKERLEGKLERLKWGKDSERIAQEKLIKEYSLKVVKMRAQFAMNEAVKKKAWALEKEPMEESTTALERQILSSRQQWQADRMRLMEEKKAAEKKQKKGKKVWSLSQQQQPLHITNEALNRSANTK